MKSRPTPQEILAHNIRRIRKQIGLSQEALASLAGIHRTYLSSVERGERNPSIVNVFRIAEALGADPRELLRPMGRTED